MIHYVYSALKRYLLCSFFCCLLCCLAACSRSPLVGSAQLDCGEGDRVISAEHLFCVYRSPRVAREEPDDMAAGEMTPTRADQGVGVSVSEATPPCPLETPHLYLYDTLYICSAERVVSDEIIESAVAAWLQDYNDEDEDEGDDEGDLGVDTRDLVDGGVGVSPSADLSAPPSPIGLVDQGVEPDRP